MRSRAFRRGGAGAGCGETGLGDLGARPGGETRANLYRPQGSHARFSSGRTRNGAPSTQASDSQPGLGHRLQDVVVSGG